MKLIRDVVPGAKVHFIWGLSVESRVRKTCVVFLNIEGNQLLDRADSIEGVQKQPLVFE